MLFCIDTIFLRNTLILYSKIAICNPILTILSKSLINKFLTKLDFHLIQSLSFLRYCFTVQAGNTENYLQ